ASGRRHTRSKRDWSSDVCSADLTAKYAKRLARAQRQLSKKKLGSANRAKARQKVAKLHAKISDCRQDNLHKLSRRLINENQVVRSEERRVGQERSGRAETSPREV